MNRASLVKALENSAAGPARSLADFLFPPVCAVCDEPVAVAHSLCPDCWRRLEFITEPMCPVLGLPFSVDLGAGALSAEALANPPPFDRARSAVRYNDTARALIASLKYADRTDLTRVCARMMARAGAELLESDAVLVPVPLHWRRQLLRRFNQSLLLARAVAETTGVELVTDGVRRVRHTRHQVGLSAAERERNVAGAFRASPTLVESLAGRRAVIVEDVITTGATVYALARTLKRAGVGHIDVISFARVVTGPE